MDARPRRFRSPYVIAGLFSLLLALIDLSFRFDSIRQHALSYLAVLPLLYAMVLLMTQLSMLPRWPLLRYFFALLAAVLMGAVYGAQYSFHTVYHQLFGAHDIGVVVNNLGYWWSNKSSLLGAGDLGPMPIFIGLFALYFLGVAFIGQNKDQAVHRSNWGFAASLVMIAASFNLVREVDARFILTPFNYTVDQVRYLVKNRAVYLDKVVGEAFPKRNQDAITAEKQRGNFNILFILHESLRGDHTSLLGYSRDTTPNQVRRFDDGYIYHHAISNAGVTRDSVHSIFTGLNPVTRNHLEKSSTIWQYAKAAGLKTFYISSHWLEWENMGKQILEPELVDMKKVPLYADPSLGRDDFITAKVFADSMPEIKSQRPFFGVVHLSNTHYPYPLPEGQTPRWAPAMASLNPGDLQQTVNQYDSAIYGLDQAVEKVMQELERANLADNTIVISTSDHGEAFYEHKQFFHGKIPWMEAYNVPLFVYIPDKLKPLFSQKELSQLQSNEQRFVSNEDIFPTVLDMLGLEPAKTLSGHSLLRNYPAGYAMAQVEGAGFIAIDSISGRKLTVNNAKRWLATTSLMKDPKEKSPTFQDLTRTVQGPQVRDLAVKYIGTAK